MTYYIGQQVEQILNGSPRFFYGLRRSDTGELYLAKMDQLLNTGVVQINQPGDPADNLPEFYPGQDFYEGRDIDHNLVYKNLNYEQFRWDDRNLYYYVNDEGELVVRINQSVVYDNGSAPDGLEG